LDEDGHGDILKETRGVFFMSTPHKGSTAANWASVVSKIGDVSLFAFPQRTRKDLLKNLKRNSDTLWSISEEFRRVMSGMDVRIASSYEQVVTNPWSELVSTLSNPLFKSLLIVTLDRG
jgi:sulfite reductase alpha subunit-like flavoprotein